MDTRKRALSLFLLVCILVGLLPTNVFASNAYVINGVTVRYDDFTSYINQCWGYANNFYDKVWGESFDNRFDDPTNILRNLSDEELTLTPEHAEAYIKAAVPGAVLRICDEEYVHGTDARGHSLFIVDIDEDGFTVFEGGLSREPYIREAYYTWSSIVGGFDYGYIKYIKWPGSTEYVGAEFVTQPEDTNTVEGETVRFSAPVLAEGMTYQWQWRADGYGWTNYTAEDAQTDTITFTATAQLHGYRYRCMVKDENGTLSFSDDAVLSVTGFQGQPESQEALENSRVTFCVNATGDGLSYQWQWRRSSKYGWSSTTVEGNKTDTITLEATTGRNGYQYRCRITDQYGNVLYSQAATLTVVQKQLATIVTQPQNISVEVGTNAVFTVGATGDGLTYQWQWLNAYNEWVNTTTSGYNTDTITVEATAARNGHQYRCMIRDDYGNVVYSDAATLTVTSSLVITAQPESVTAAVGETVAFTVQVSGRDITYQWQWLNASGEWVNTTAIGSNTDTMHIEAFGNRNGYQYRCRVSDEYGNVVYSDAAVLTVIATLEIISHPASVMALVDDSVTFTVEAKGSGLTYQWQWRSSAAGTWANTTVTGCKTDTISLTATAARNGYQYRCVITDDVGNVAYTDAAGLTVSVENKISIVRQPSSVFATLGSSVVFTVEADGDNLTYLWQWRKNADSNWATTTVSGYRTNSITVSATASRNGYQYRCVITDADGNKVYSDPATLTIDQDGIAAIVRQPVSVSVAAGTTVTFAVEATGEDLSYQWQWRKNSSSAWASTSVAGNKTACITMEATMSRDGYQYRCKITDAGGNVVYSDAATLSIVQQTETAIIAQPMSVAAEPGSMVSFTVDAIGDGLRYQWQWLNKAGSWVNTTASGFDTDTITVEATAARNGYQYRCKITDGYGNVFYSDAAALTIASSLEITGQPQSVTAELGQEVTFTVSASGGKLTYQWQWLNKTGSWVNTTASGYDTDTITVTATAARNGYQYRCKVSDSYGNVLYSDAALLLIESRFEIVAQPQSVNAELDEQISFGVEVSGDNVSYQWQWRKNDSSAWATTTVTGYKTNTITLRATAARNGYQYRCKITSGLGDVYYSDVATLTILSSLELLSQPQDVTAELGTTATFAVEAEGAGLTYLWQWRNGSDGVWATTTVTGYKTNSIQVSATAARNGYQYRCMIKDATGAVIYSEPASLTVFAILEITAQPEDVTAEVGQTVTFTVEVRGNNVSYQWQWLNAAGEWVDTYPSGYRTDTITLEASSTRNGYQYRCMVSDPYGNVCYSEPATLTAVSTLAITGQPENVAAVAGETATFTVEASGNGITYQWQRLNANGTWSDLDIAGADTDTITVEANSTNAGSQYRCRITDCYGDRIYSEAATLTVTSTLEIVAQPVNASVELGGTAAFNVVVSGNDVSYQWQWLNASGEWVSTTTQGYSTDTLSVEVTATRNGYQYRCMVSDAYGNVVYSEPATLTVTSTLEIISQPESAEVELGSTALFTVEVEGNSVRYQWQWLNSYGEWVNTTTTGYNTNTLTVVASAARNGYQYRCKVYDTYGNECYCDAVTLTVTSYVQITGQPESVTAQIGTTVTFRVTVEGSSVSYQWQYLGSSGNWINVNTTGYNTDTITMEATGARNGNQYRCRITNGLGEIIYSDAVALTVTSTLEITNQPESATVPTGTQASFTVEVSGYEISYQWQYLGSSGSWANTTASGYNTNELIVEANSTRNGYQYRCLVSDSCGNVLYTDAVTLTVTSTLEIIAQPEDISVELGSTATFTVEVSGNDVRYQWQWMNAAGQWVNTTATGYNTDTISIPATAARNGYQYRCVVSDDYGNVIYSDAAMLTVA